MLYRDWIDIPNVKLGGGESTFLHSVFGLCMSKYMRRHQNTTKVFLCCHLIFKGWQKEGFDINRSKIYNGTHISRPKTKQIFSLHVPFDKRTTTVQKLDVPGPDEKFCLCWLCAFTKFSSGGAIFLVHLIFERL